jgi:DNA-binding MarR family transcriptional regulator
MAKEAILATRFEVPKEFQIWHLLHTVDTEMLRAWENELRELGVTPIATALLHAVQGSGEPVTLTELSRWLFRRPHSISELVTRMSKQGLIKKVTSRGKKGTVRVALTKKGQEVWQRSTDKLEVVGRIMSALSTAEADQLMTYLRRLQEKMLDEQVVSAHQPLPWARLSPE